MSKQDRQGVRTPMQLEQKYDLGAYERNDKSYAQLESQTNQLNQTLAQFMAETNGKIAELEEENTTTFFGSGVPTLDNYPASDWTSDELKDMHIGNMYQDEDTDYTYLFKCTDGVYEWVQCKSEGSGGGTPSGDITVSNITDLTVSAEELNYLDGVTSNVQEQLNQITEDTSDVQEQISTVNNYLHNFIIRKIWAYEESITLAANSTFTKSPYDVSSIIPSGYKALSFKVGATGNGVFCYNQMVRSNTEVQFQLQNCTSVSKTITPTLELLCIRDI